MVLNLVQKALRFGEGKKLKKLQEKVVSTSAWEEETAKFSDEELKAKTGEFKKRLKQGEALDDLLPEAFAVVREAAKRTLNMRHFDVQIMGGVVLHEGKIAEMATGEGKTLVATLPAYLNTLAGQGVHIVTVNDYLAKRDTQWMGPIYNFLGVSVGVLQHEAAYIYDPTYQASEERWRNLHPVSRKEAYQAEITYGTNSEFGFDYLRDNMALSLEEMAQRGHNFAIVDEVDSILIDEARTPLIISGPAQEWRFLYEKVDRVISGLKGTVVVKENREEEAGLEEKYDYIANEKERTIKETQKGQERIARALGIPVARLFGGEEYEEEEVNLAELELLERTRNAIRQAITAQALYQKDRDYVVKEGGVIIVDEFTGRLMIGRRYSEGLHEAIEAKEKVRIQEETQTLATITLQNYFRMYEKLAGMTGTAATEADEFMHIYGLEVVVIPPNKPLRRKTLADAIYKTEELKFKAVVEDIAKRHNQGQPVLVGTISIEKSERLNRLLKSRGIPHQVLNAKYHEREAEIVAQAGREKTVTIATNMAGRGTDIVLGGNPCDLNEAKEVIEAGGLHVLGTERHEARRIDNQLRGRSGRQGDPGSSQFYLSLEDDLMRLFGSERISRLMERLRLPDDIPIEHPLVSRAIETAQKQVESQNFMLRKHVLEYDDVMNKQREVVYKERFKVLSSDDFHKKTEEFFQEVIEAAVQSYLPREVHPEEWDLEGLFSYLQALFPLHLSKNSFDLKTLSQEEMAEKLKAASKETYKRREETLGKERLKELEKRVMLEVIDNRWREHLYEMDYLKEGIGLRALGQRDPLVEFKAEAFERFQAMTTAIKEDFMRYIFHVEVAEERARPRLVAVPVTEPTGQPALVGQTVPTSFEESEAVPAEATRGAEMAAGEPLTLPQKGPKIGRNEPCPCGAVDPRTGKPIKYKKCHGK